MRAARSGVHELVRPSVPTWLACSQARLIGAAGNIAHEGYRRKPLMLRLFLQEPCSWDGLCRRGLIVFAQACTELAMRFGQGMEAVVLQMCDQHVALPALLASLECHPMQQS